MACASIRRASSLLEVLWFLCHFGFNCLFCFVMVCLRCHPDVGLGRWLVWFNYVPVFLSVLAVAYLLGACMYFLCLLSLMHAASQPCQKCTACHSIPAQSTLQLITLPGAGHGKVFATESVRRWQNIQSASTTSACSTTVAALTQPRQPSADAACNCSHCRYYHVQAG